MLLLVMMHLTLIEAGNVGTSVPESDYRLEWYSFEP
jgi:hypothetical protein